MKKFFFLFVFIHFMASSSFAQKKYAVFIVGDLSVQNNIPLTDLWRAGGDGEMDEFWNDTYLMWEMLQNKGFHPDSIFVLLGDGHDKNPFNPRYKPGTNTTVVDDMATEGNVIDLFQDLSNGTNNRPKITEDDFLFVWVFDHGGYNYTTEHSYIHLYGNVSMIDTAFANLVNRIPAHRKAFWMQQCHGGGFADDLSASNTVFISASQADKKANRADNYRISDDGELLNYPENESYSFGGINEMYNHGEFDYHMISVVNKATPTYVNNYANEPFANSDLNGDSIVSMMEAFRWDTIHNSRKTWAGLQNQLEDFEDAVYDDIGCIGSRMSFEYPTLLFDNIADNETHRGIVGISKDLVVADGQILTFTGKSDVTLCDSVTLTIEEGATLVIDGKVNFKGTTNNLLVIHGNLVQRENSSLRFSNMQVVSDAAELSITEASFKNTELKYKPAGSSSISESSELTGSVTIRNCKFHNPSKPYAIYIENSRDFEVDGDTVTACLHNGIFIKNSGNVTTSPLVKRKVRNSVISGCMNTGLIIYASTVQIFSNHIYGNGVGVKLFNKCNILDFSGNCAALSENQTQFIHDNTSYEIYISSGSNPQNMHFNSIHKTNAGTVPFVYYDNAGINDNNNSNGRVNIDVSDNEWGNNFNPSTHLYSTTILVGFVYLPYWGFDDCPGSPSKGRLLSVADSLCNAGAYEAAKAVYQQVIAESPTTVSAETALKSLLPLESLASGNFEALKHYYLTDSIIASHGRLSYLSNYLANRCDEILANYDEAIAWYEGVITNPESSFADSVFATIDLGNLYLEMEGNGVKAEGKLIQYKPKSRHAFDLQCEQLLLLLPSEKTITPSLVSHRSDPLPNWTDTIVSQPEGYMMDVDGNVEISSSDGLAWLISVVNGLNGCEPDNFEGRTVKLANDIDFGAEGLNYCFSPIGTRETPFLGTFDGDGHKIHHICQHYSIYDGVDNYYFDMGVFGYIRHATVKNVTLDSTCKIYSNCYYPDFYRGGMVGFSDSLSLVDNVYIHSQRIGHVFGSCLVGMNRNSTVRNCACGGNNNLSGYQFGTPEEGAALVAYNLCDGGFADAVVENCYLYGWIGSNYSTRYVAGLVCFNETLPNSNGKRAILRNCHSTPTKEFLGFTAYGSIAAVLYEGSSIRNCYTDPTKMYQYARMVGQNLGGEFRDCSNYTNVNSIGKLWGPVTVNDTTTDYLLDALNLWIAGQEHPELYRTWTINTDSIPVFGDYYVGVPENRTTDYKFTVHPNPTNGMVTIMGENLQQAEVTNMLGQQVLSVQDEGDELRIDMTSLPSGVYLVTVTDKSGRKSVQKLVKE